MKHLVILCMLASLLCSCGDIGGTAPGPDMDTIVDEDWGDTVPRDAESGDLGDVDDVVLDEADICTIEWTAVACTDHSQCDDNVFCNGEERCGKYEYGYVCYRSTCHKPCEAAPGEDPACHPCVCIEDQQMLAYPLKDSDGDGYVDMACAGDDCDDSDKNAHPGMADLCDSLDNNCNALVDEDGWKQPDGLEVANPVSSAAAASSHHAIVSLDDTWQAAWLEDDGESFTIRFAGIAYDVDEEEVTVESRDLWVVSGSDADDITISDLSIIGSAGSYYVAWVESAPDGDSVRIKRHDTDPAIPPGTLFESDTRIYETVIKNLHGSSVSAGLLFRMAADDDSGDFEIYYVPVADFTDDPPEEPAAPTRLTQATGFSGNPDAAPLPDGGWMVVWEDERDGNKEIYLRKIDFEGNPDPGMRMARRLTDAPVESQEPAIARMGTGASEEYAVVWTDGRNGVFEIYSMIVDGGGDQVSPELVHPSPSENAWQAAVIADADRQQYMVAYSAGTFMRYDIYMTFTDRETPRGLESRTVRTSEASLTKPVMATNCCDDVVAMLWQEIVRGSSPSIHLEILQCTN
ncbi:MAG: putative metal-binding motif-containing protein [Pseudomonadota bacterium]